MAKLANIFSWRKFLAIRYLNSVVYCIFILVAHIIICNLFIVLKMHNFIIRVNLFGNLQLKCVYHVASYGLLPYQWSAHG